MMRNGGLRLNLVFRKELKGESLRDKREILGREERGLGNLEGSEEKSKRKREEFLEEKLKKKREKNGDLSLEILDFLKRRR